MSQPLGNRLVKSGYWPLPIWLILPTIAVFFVDDYSIIASHVSVMTLETGIAKWLTNLAALGSGLALILFGVGVWRVSQRRFSGGGLAFIIFGISMIANGIWPMGSPMHGLYAIGIINILGPALTYMDVDGSKIGRHFHAITVGFSLAGIFYLWILLTGLDPQGYSGLTQRVFGSLTFLWPLIFALHWSKRKVASPT